MPRGKKTLTPAPAASGAMAPGAILASGAKRLGRTKRGHKMLKGCKNFKTVSLKTVDLSHAIAEQRRVELNRLQLLQEAQEKARAQPITRVVGE